MRSTWFAAVVASAAAFTSTACGPETTSFRTTDRGDESDRPGPPAAAYDVNMNEQPIAQVHVWSNGGYISIGGEPMTHIGFEIHNASLRPIVFDEDALVLIAFDNAGAELPGVRLMSIEPIGPTLRPVRPGATLILGGYFMIPVRPRAVDAMQVQWALRAGDQRYLQVTRFTRDDDYPVLDAPRTAELRHPRA